MPGTLLHPEGLAEILKRVDALRPDSGRRWGRMTSHQAICHLADSFEWSLGRREGTTGASLRMPPWVLRLVALRLPFPWPRGVPTMREMDQTKDGTPPTKFEADRERLSALIQEFAGRPASEPWPLHPMFAVLSRANWGRWGYRHCDHHFRQFGV